MDANLFDLLSVTNKVTNIFVAPPFYADLKTLLGCRITFDVEGCGLCDCSGEAHHISIELVEENTPA